jgi:type I restriction enzyme, S subunit
MKSYTEYKPSGIESLGDIPAHWKINKLNRICYMKGRIGWQGLKQSEFTSEGPYLITGMNFKDGVIRWDEVYHITEDRYNEAPEIQLKVGDVLMTKDGTIGKLLYVDNMPDKASLNSHLLVLRPLGNHFYPKYLYYLLHSNYFKDYVELCKTGTTFFGLTQEAAGKFKMLLPPLHEQQSIVELLDNSLVSINNFVEKKQKLIELLNEEKSAIIHHAVTKGINPVANVEVSGIDFLGTVPKHWEIKKIKLATQVFRGKFTHRPRNDPKFYGGEYPFIQTGEVSKASKYVETYSQTLNDIGLEVSKKFPSGTLVMTIAANVGDVAIINFDACFPDSIVGFKPHESIDINYLYHFFVAIKKEIVSTAVLNTQLNLNIDRIENIYMVIPPEHEQKEIVQFIEGEINKIEFAISRIEKEIDFIREYNIALISETVTGKIDVRDGVLT